jgi:hypothetical protein
VDQNGTRTEIQTTSNFTQFCRFIIAGTLVVGLRKTLTHPKIQVFRVDRSLYFERTKDRKIGNSPLTNGGPLFALLASVYLASGITWLLIDCTDSLAREESAERALCNESRRECGKMPHQHLANDSNRSPREKYFKRPGSYPLRKSLCL